MRDQPNREALDATLAGLVGRTVTGVGYWDIHNYGAEPQVWDHGSWHIAVMGVELGTDAGPVTIAWNRGVPWIQVLRDPMARHLRVDAGEVGPHRIGPDGPSAWDALLDHPIRAARATWGMMTFGPSRSQDGTVVEPGYDLHFPVAVRVDFDGGAVWFVAALPCYELDKPLTLDRATVPGDEIVVTFDERTVAGLGIQP